jgi:hypothetical protein
MPRRKLGVIIALVLWILWCIFAVTELVPVIRRYLTMWPGFMAYVLCIVPLLTAAFVTLVRVTRTQRR